jgi:hypothetical protein
MTDEFTLRKQLEQSANAKVVLESEAFQSAYNAVGAAIIEGWKNCPIRDKEAAHEMRLMWDLHKAYMGHLTKAVEDGKLAAAELRKDKTITQKLAERLRIA